MREGNGICFAIATIHVSNTLTCLKRENEIVIQLFVKI